MHGHSSRRNRGYGGCIRDPTQSRHSQPDVPAGWHGRGPAPRGAGACTRQGRHNGGTRSGGAPGISGRPRTSFCGRCLTRPGRGARAGGLPRGCPSRTGAAVCCATRGRSGYLTEGEATHLLCNGNTPSPTVPGASSSLETTASIWSVTVDTSPARGSSAGTHGATRPGVSLPAAGELFDSARDACFEVKNFGPGRSDRDVLSGRTDALPRPCKRVG